MLDHRFSGAGTFCYPGNAFWHTFVQLAFSSRDAAAHNTIHNLICSVGRLIAGAFAAPISKTSAVKAHGRNPALETDAAAYRCSCLVCSGETPATVSP